MTYINDDVPRVRTVTADNIEGMEMAKAILRGHGEVEQLRISSVRDRSWDDEHDNALRTAENLDRLAQWAGHLADAIREEREQCNQSE